MQNPSKQASREIYMIFTLCFSVLYIIMYSMINIHVVCRKLCDKHLTHTIKSAHKLLLCGTSYSYTIALSGLFELYTREGI